MPSVHVPDSAASFWPTCGVPVIVGDGALSTSAVTGVVGSLGAVPDPSPETVTRIFLPNWSGPSVTAHAVAPSIAFPSAVHWQATFTPYGQIPDFADKLFSTWATPAIAGIIVRVNFCCTMVAFV